MLDSDYRLLDSWMGIRLAALLYETWQVWQQLPDDRIGSSRPAGNRLIDSVRLCGMRNTKEHPTKRYTACER